MNALMLFAGLLLHMLLKLSNAIKEAKNEKTEFVLWNWFQSESLYFIITILCCLISIAMIQIEPGEPIRQGGYIIDWVKGQWFIMGYSGASLIFNFASLKK